MARIRSIKPDFWASEQVADVSHSARLAFIGLWNFSDDNGIHPASIKRLKMQIFPGDDLTGNQVAALVGELLHVGLLVEYEADGKLWWIIPTWHQHQPIDKPTYRYPSPNFDRLLADNCTVAGKNGRPPVTRYLFDSYDIETGENSTSIGLAFVSGNGNGNGTGNGTGNGNGIIQTLSDSPPSAPASDGARESVDLQGSEGDAADPVQASRTAAKGRVKAQAAEILHFLNRKTGRHYRAVDANLDLIAARLREGYTTAELRAVIARQCRKWGNDPDRQEYLRPKTLFGRLNFAQYVGEVPPEALQAEADLQGGGEIRH